MSERKPRLLDLFCGAGGAGVGYALAGFDVVGVDIAAQPRYPYEFAQADALEVLACGGIDAWLIEDFDAIHASPPCQRAANVTKWRGDPKNHPELIPPTRELLEATGLPWIIENVPEAPIRADFLLCGSMFGLKVKRHRAFEVGNWDLAPPLRYPCGSHKDLLPFMHKGERAYADAMGCDWMNSKEARQAIPPAYTQNIGFYLIRELNAKAKFKAQTPAP